MSYLYCVFSGGCCSDSTILTSGKDPLPLMNGYHDQRSLQTHESRQTTPTRSKSTDPFAELENELQIGTSGLQTNGLLYKRRQHSLPAIDGIYKSVFGARRGRNQVLPESESKAGKEETDRHDRHTM